jgi:osmotically-inducible protein OsmY
MADDRWRDEEWRRGDDDRHRFGRQRYSQGGGYGSGEHRPYHEDPESQSQWDDRSGFAQDHRRRFGEAGSRQGYSGEQERNRSSFGGETWRGGYGEGWVGGGYGGGYLGGRGSSRGGSGEGWGDYGEGEGWTGRQEGYRGGSFYGGQGYGGPGYGRHGYGGQGWRGYGEGWTGGRREAGYGRGREQDRSWFDRAADEVSSWFGDEEAEHRRRRDQERGHYGKGPRGYSRSDDRIREDVNDRLTDDWQIDASEIEVTVSSGEVTLNGTVTGREEKRRAEDIAENVSGVRHVQNNLRLQSSGTGLPSTEASTTTGAKIRQAGSSDTTAKR